MDMTAFNHKVLESRQLDTNRLISLIASRQALSPTAQAAMAAAIQQNRARSDVFGVALAGPSFNASIAQLITETKER